MIYFELIFGYDVQCGQKFNFFLCACSIVSAPFVEKTVFCPPNYSYTLLKNQLLLCVDLFMDSLFCFIDLFFFYIDADTVSHTPSYYSFMMSLEIRWCWSSNCVLLKDFPSLSSENKARVHVQSSSSSSLPGQALERISKNNCSPSSASLLSSNSCPGDPLKP